jgi:hypothetical protein
MKLKVTVTQSDIDAGVARECGRCPVALALARVVPAGLTVIVGCISATLLSGAPTLPSFHTEIPEIARDFISAFDEGRPVEPVEFFLDFNPYPRNDR